MTSPIPPIVAVYLQPKRNLPTWKARGCNVAFGRDREANSDGSDGVTLPVWQASATAAGLGYIVEPSADIAADGRDQNRKGFLQKQDEPDGAIINAQDAKNAAAEEAVYVALETMYASCKALAPNIPVYVNIDANQVPYMRSNYARIFKAADKITCDFYAVQRGQPIATYLDLINKIKAIPGGNKLSLAWIETSFQHLNPTYFPGKRGPTVAEWQAEVAQAVAAGLNIGYFPQCIGEDGLAPFSTDATPADIAAAMTAWANPGGVGAAIGSSNPFAGCTLTDPSGKAYTIQPK